MKWMLQTGDTARPEAFLQELAHRSPQHVEILMTIAQRLEQKGLEKGMPCSCHEATQWLTVELWRPKCAAALFIPP